MEVVTIKISKDLLQFLTDNDLLKPGSYEVKTTDIQDDFFDNDPVYQSYKKESTKAYKKLKEYEYNKRFNGTNT